MRAAENLGRFTVTAAAGDDVVMDRAADTTTTATRVRILTLIPTGADGWIGAQQQLVATLTLTHTNDASPWLVNGITVDKPLAGMPESDTQDFG